MEDRSVPLVGAFDQRGARLPARRLRSTTSCAGQHRRVLTCRRRPPDGTVTIAFTDIEDSTTLNGLGDDRWLRAARAQRGDRRALGVRRHRREEPGRRLHVAFPSSRRAACAIAPSSTSSNGSTTPGRPPDRPARGEAVRSPTTFGHAVSGAIASAAAGRRRGPRPDRPDRRVPVRRATTRGARGQRPPDAYPVRMVPPLRWRPRRPRRGRPWDALGRRRRPADGVDRRDDEAAWGCPGVARDAQGSIVLSSVAAATRSLPR